MNCLTLLVNVALLALAPNASVYQIVGPAALRTTSAPKNPLRTQASNGLRASSNAIRALTGVAGPLGAMLLHVPLLRTWRTMVEACSGSVTRVPFALSP